VLTRSYPARCSDSFCLCWRLPLFRESGRESTLRTCVPVRSHHVTKCLVTGVGGITPASAGMCRSARVGRGGQSAHA
jgi:hypothetical protein